MGNVGKEAKLTDVFYQVEMQRQHEDVSALLDNIPLGELENDLPDIDVSLFLGEDSSDMLNDLDLEGGISLSSYDSDEFENLINGDSVKPQLPTLRKERNARRLINFETTNKRNITIKQEPPELEDSRQNLLVGKAHETYSVKKEVKKEKLDSDSNTGDEEMADYTFYIAPKKKKNRKRKNAEYCKRRKGKSDKELKIVIKRKEKQSDYSNSTAMDSTEVLSSGEKVSSFSENSDVSPPQSLTDFSFCDIPFTDHFSTSIAEKVKTKRRCNMKNSPERDDMSNSSKTEEKIVRKKRKVSVGRKDNRTKELHNEGYTYAKANQIRMQNNQILNTPQKTLTLQNSSGELRTDSPRNCDVPIFSLNKTSVSNNTNNSINWRSPVYERILPSRSSNFHDYSKPIPSNHCNDNSTEKGTSRCMPRLIPIAPKPVSLRSDTNHVTRSLRRMSSELKTNLTYAQEIEDVPVSMAEVEVASFEDAVEIPVESRLNQSSKLKPHFSNISPDIPNNKMPVILLTPISKKEIALNNIRIRRSETNYRNAKTDSLSTVQVPVLLQRQNRSKKSMSNSDSRSLSSLYNSKETPYCDKLKPKSYKVNSDVLRSTPEKFKKFSQLKSSANNNTQETLFFRPSTRSRTKSPEKQYQSNSNSKKEIENRSQNSSEKDEIEARRVNFDNRKAIEERRVVYVGKLPEHFTPEYVEKLFSRFGEIENVQIKVRESDSTNECGSIFDHEYGDWNLTSSLRGIEKWKKIYGFVTFKRQCDVARAIEEGEKMWPELKLNYGGRREFVKVNYSDLDGNFAEKTNTTYGYASKNNEDDFDFARELKAAQQRCGLGQNSLYFKKS